MWTAILDAVERAEDAALGLDTAGYREARALFDRHYEAVRRHARESRDQALLNQSFMLKHFIAELDAATRQGLLHDHSHARRQLQKAVAYRRYLQSHHRARH